jgi:hypothetical protein
LKGRNMNDVALHDNYLRGHEALWKRFVHPENHLCYDQVFTDAGQFPTPAEVAAEIPSCAGWGTGMEDCCLTAGFVMEAMLTAHRVTGRAEWGEKARTLFQGLVELGTVSGVPGYVARGFAPGRRDVYPNSSADQYTSYVWGLWNYGRSGAANAAERAMVARLLGDVARRVESSGGDIPRMDGRPSIYGDTAAITADRACRLLMFYKAAADATGDAHWQQRYVEKVEENGRARLRCHYGPEPWPDDRNVHCVIQSQAAFRLLYDAETDPAIRLCYREALRAQAVCIVNRIPRWREVMAKPMGKALPPRWRECWAAFRRTKPDYDPSRPEYVNLWHRYYRDHRSEFPHPPEILAAAPPAVPWLRHQTQGLAVIMMSVDPEPKQQIAGEARAMLAGVDWRLVAEAGVWEGLEPGYWRGVESGIFSA